MGRFLLAVTVLLSLAGAGFALKCYKCSGSEEMCSKSKLQGDKDTYLKTCLSSNDRCGRSWVKKDGKTLVTNDCSSQLACDLAKTACDKLEDTLDNYDCAVGCCSEDACNAGSPVTFSLFLLIVSTVLNLALMK